MSAVSPLNSSSSVNHTIIVLSGKGGVGKSTVACQLALSLAHISRKRVGILDVDICGPSVPKICGVEDRSITKCPKTDLWLPVEVPIPKLTAAAASSQKQRGDDRACLKVMSIAYLLPNATDAVVWRGPRKDAMIKQFLSDVNWGDLDYLIVDTPPGTSDEHMTLCEAFCKVATGGGAEGTNGDVTHVGPTGAVVVTTPQDVSTDDVRKELNFCAKLHLRVLGIVENMSGFVCPNCSESTDIFSKGGGRKLSDLYQCPFLGTIPIDPRISVAQDNGESVAVMNLLEEQLAWKESSAAEKASGGGGGGGDGGEQKERGGEDSEAMFKEAGANGILDVVQNIRALAFKVERLRKEGKAM